jgi:hypothetical protein
LGAYNNYHILGLIAQKNDQPFLDFWKNFLNALSPVFPGMQKIEWGIV